MGRSILRQRIMSVVVDAIVGIPSCGLGKSIPDRIRSPLLGGRYECVVECDVPRHSALGKALIERADFRDAYRAPLTRSDLDVVDIFFGIFGERPGSMNLMLIARNKVVGLAGLEVPTSLEIMNMEKRDRYFVGEKIGPWPISSAPTNSLRAGTTSTWIIGSRS